MEEEDLHSKTNGVLKSNGLQDNINGSAPADGGKTEGGQGLAAAGIDSQEQSQSVRGSEEEKVSGTAQGHSHIPNGEEVREMESQREGDKKEVSPLVEQEDGPVSSEQTVSSHASSEKSEVGASVDATSSGSDCVLVETTEDSSSTVKYTGDEPVNVSTITPPDSSSSSSSSSSSATEARNDEESPDSSSSQVEGSRHESSGRAPDSTEDGNPVNVVTRLLSDESGAEIPIVTRVLRQASKEDEAPEAVPLPREEVGLDEAGEAEVSETSHQRAAAGAVDSATVAEEDNESQTSFVNEYALKGSESPTYEADRNLEQFSEILLDSDPSDAEGLPVDPMASAAEKKKATKRVRFADEVTQLEGSELRLGPLTDLLTWHPPSPPPPPPPPPL